MDDFDYKKYSLEKLETWMSDALTSAEATPQEIYDTIHKVVEEEYHYHKHNTGRCYDLLALMNGNRIIQEVTATGELWDKEDKITSCDKDDPSPECKKSWVDFWEETYYPEEHKQYTEEELNAMCDAAEEKEKCREYNLREAEYYNKRAELDAIAEQVKAAGGYEWTPVTVPSKPLYVNKDGDVWIPDAAPKKDKVVKWQLPVEEVKDEDTDENIYCVTFPDDLLEAANLKEGDTIEWVDQGDGSYLLKKV